ncbi:UvrD-helicase domain-containing protein [Spongiibacter sp. KMU-158]|uniref:DNA 3'-5' helicase n=1 Tax=Spongiibacter pelagi TaxID=2760804 RepID=A0A927GVR7_9GAMM|nr:UvrD-helicase domain-containing protein [Spongiibacter pelagi]MBD2857659.1 UvrD-helicase domain-containing protein [Spongiibacter pelagi]
MTHFAFPPDQAQRDTAIDPSKSVLVRAPAGSGKTGVLLLRYLNCLMTVQAPEQIVAITFTNKAAGEIRERVLSALRKGDSDAPADNGFDAQLQNIVAQVKQRDAQLAWNLLDNSARLRIQTFDSFCASLTRRLPLLSGLGAAKPLTDTEALYREAILDLFQRIEQPESNPELAQALLRLLAYGSNRIETLVPLLAALLAKRDQWLKDVLNGDLALMDQALKQEVAGHFDRTWQIVCDANIDDLIGAFIESSGHNEKHSWAADLRQADQMGLDELPLIRQIANAVLKGDGSLYVPRSVNYAGFVKSTPGYEQAKNWLAQKDDSGEAEQVANALNILRELPPAGLPEGSRQLVADFQLALRHLLAHLRLIFEARGGVDFAEIAQRAIYALEAEDPLAGQALLDEQRIQHILVDEMQDTSVGQIELLKNLCQDWQPDDGRSVFFCGDLQQSIYAFRGSLVSLFDGLIREGEFAGKKLELLQLQANFRSSPDLVNWVNSSFKTLFTDRGFDYEPAIAQRSNPGGVEIHAMIQDAGVSAKAQAASYEAQQIIEIVQRVLSEDQAQQRQSSIGILVRSRPHLAAIIPALKQAGIPFCGQDIDNLAETPAILEFTALIRALWHEADNLAWTRLLRASFVGLAWEDIRRLRINGGVLREVVFAAPESRAEARTKLSPEGEQRLGRLVGVLTAIEQRPESRDLRWALRTAWYQLGGPATVDEAAHQDIRRVFALLDEHAPAGILQDIAALERAIAKLFATPAAAQVEVMTVHKSKGLEFDVVLLPGLGRKAPRQDNLLLVWQRLQGHMVLAPKPVSKQADADGELLYKYLASAHAQEIETELDRQIYVALTRARRELHLFGMAETSSKGELSVSSSSYLGHLWPVLAPYFEGAASLPAPVQFTEEDPEDSMAVPIAPRLGPVEIELDGYYQPSSQAESLLEQARRFSDNAVLEDNIEQRASGIVFHELMERIGRGNDIQRWQQGLASRRWDGAIAQRLRHHCHPEPELADSVKRVVHLLEQTLSCETGRWMLDSYSWQGSEQTLRQFVGGQWQTLILDRVFIENPGTAAARCWIIDYKTAQASGKREQFFAAQLERYSEKMQRYAEALAAAGIEVPIIPALYFPAHQTLLEIR